MFEPLPWPAVAHCAESRLICQFQVYSRASGYPILPFLPFPCSLAFPDSPRVTSSLSTGWHGNALIQREHPEWSGSPPQRKTRQRIPGLKNQQLIDSPCSRESASQVFSSHLGHLSMLFLLQFLSTEVNFEKKPQNKTPEKNPPSNNPKSTRVRGAEALHRVGGICLTATVLPCLLFSPFSAPACEMCGFGWFWLNSHEALPSAGRSHTWLREAPAAPALWRGLKYQAFYIRLFKSWKRKKCNAKGGKKSSAPKGVFRI